MALYDWSDDFKTYKKIIFTYLIKLNTLYKTPVLTKLTQIFLCQKNLDDSWVYDYVHVGILYKNLHQKSRQVNNYSKALLYGLAGCSPPMFTKRSSWIFLPIFIDIINKDLNHSSQLPNNLKDESLKAIKINLSFFLSGMRRNLEQINIEERNNIKREIGKRRPN